MASVLSGNTRSKRLLLERSPFVPYESFVPFCATGTIELNLSCMPKPTKSARKCGLNQLPAIEEGKASSSVETVSLFDQKRVYGWWPVITEEGDERMISVMFMCLCLCLCMSVCMSVCMYLCMYLCMYACLSVCLSVCMYVCMYVCMSMSVCMCPCLIRNGCTGGGLLSQRRMI